MSIPAPLQQTSLSWLKKNLLFGNEPSLELAALLSVYFIQGILGLARLAVSFFLKDELGFSPAQMGALLGIAALPWVIKPLLGLLSDGFPLWGYRRRSYLLLSGLAGAVSWLALGAWVHSAWQATLVLLLTSLSVAVADVIADSVVVERAQGESLGRAGSLQSLTWGAAALGGVLTAYFSGLLLEWFNARQVFYLTALFPLLTVVAALGIRELKSADQPLSPLKSAGSQLRLVGRTLRQKSILFPTIFIFLWQATPSADSAFFYFTTNELGFEPEFLGRVRLVTSLASLLGIAIYQKFLKTVPFRRLLGWSTALSCALGMTALLLVTHANRSLGIDDHWFSLGDSLILTVMGQVAFMPVLVISARLCPPGIEATLFALLMSIWNLSGLASMELGALLTHWLGVTETQFENLGLLVVLTNLSTLLPLPLLGWLPDGDPQAEIRHSPVSVELFERHALGSLGDQNFLPEFIPESPPQSEEAELSRRP
jgi:folate/biopterin transporter